MELPEDPPRLARPPVWPSLVAPFAAILALSVVSGRRDESPTAILAGIVPAELAFLGVALFFALAERERPWRRLGFARWRGSAATIALAVLGTLGLQFLISLAMGSLIDEPSEPLRRLGELFARYDGLAAAGVALLISVPPGICEEALFRGYVQGGLLRRWSPTVAIGVAGLWFALAHWDVQHTPAVLPLGLWFGWVAWKTGSTWPAVLAHLVNNLAAFLTARYWGEAETLEPPTGPAYHVVGAVCVALMIAAIVKLRRISAEPARGAASPALAAPAASPRAPA